MSPLAQLYRRHRERLAGPGLWVDPPADLPWREFTDGGNPQLLCNDEPTHRALAAAGAPVSFGAFPGGALVDRIVFTLPREKARQRLQAQYLAGRLAPTGTLWAAGESRAGARSAQAQLSPWFGSVRKADSARHCVLWEASEPLPGPPFELTQHVENWTLEGTDLHIASLPGVFAHGGLDAGTRLLLAQLDTLVGMKPDSALDLGCGAGVIGAALLQRLPGLELTLADASALALTATRATLARNALEARVVASDGLRGVDGRFELVISNPPFHQGHRERADLGAGLFDGITRTLEPGGRCVLVVNRHLPWPRWMDDTFGGHEVLAQDAGYQVLLGRLETRRSATRPTLDR